MIPDEPHPLEGLLRRLPAETMPAEWRDNLMFQAGRAAVMKGKRWRDAALLAVGLVAGIAVSVRVFPGQLVDAPSPVARVADQPTEPAAAWPTTVEPPTAAEQAAWNIRLRVLAEGVDVLPVPAPAMSASAPLSRMEMLREVMR